MEVAQRSTRTRHKGSVYREKMKKSTFLLIKVGAVYIFVSVLLCGGWEAEAYDKPPSSGLLARLSVASEDDNGPAHSEEFLGKIKLEEKEAMNEKQVSFELSDKEVKGIEVGEELQNWAATLFQASRKAFKQPKAPLPKGTLSLKQCLKRALEVHGPALIAREEYRLAQLRYKEALRNLFPSANIEAEGIQGTTTGEDFRGRGIDLKMQQPVWDGAKKWKLFKQAKINMEIAKRNYDKIVNDLEADMRKAYSVLVSTQQNLRERKNLVVEGEKVFQAAQERFHKKVIREVEFMAVSNQFNEMTYQLNAAEREWVLAQLSLKQLLRCYEDAPLEVEGSLSVAPLEVSMEKCLELAYKNRPDYLLSKLGVDVQRYGRDIAKNDTGFQVNADGTLGYKAESFDTEDLNFKGEYFVGLSGSLPLWDHILESNTIIQNTVPTAGQTTSTDFRSETLRLNLFNNTGKSRRLEALIRYHRALDDLEKTKRNLLFQVGQAYFDYRKTLEGIASAAEKQKLEEKEAELAEIQVGLNEATLSDLMSALGKKTAAKIELNNVQAAYFNSLSELNRAVGGIGVFPLNESLVRKANYSITPSKKDTYEALFGDPQ